MYWLHAQEFLSSLKWAAAGMIGAMIVTRFHRDELASRSDYVGFVASGAAIAHFMTGPVNTFLDLGPDSAGAVGFLLGAFGGSMFQAVVRALKAADLWGLFRSRLGGD